MPLLREDVGMAGGWSVEVGGQFHRSGGGIGRQGGGGGERERALRLLATCCSDLRFFATRRTILRRVARRMRHVTHRMRRVARRMRHVTHRMRHVAKYCDKLRQASNDRPNFTTKNFLLRHVICSVEVIC
jgi:hypothetical protein